MRTEIWYSLGGFVLLSWLFIGLGAALSLGKIQAWATYACAVMAAGMSLIAGSYATQDTWIESLFSAIVGLHPIILIIAGLLLISLVVSLVKATVPDRLMAYSMSSALVVAAFWVPMMTEHAVPPGDVGDLTRSVSTTVSTALVDSTSGWFGGQGSTDKGKGNTGQGSPKGGPR